MSVKFVTKAQFDLIRGVADRHFEPWFARSLAFMWATACRPAEVMGAPKKNSRSEHHGLRGVDFMPDFRVHVCGKNTRANGSGKLKPREVVCTDREMFRELKEQAAADMDARIFTPNFRNPLLAFEGRMDRLKTLLPADLQGFSARWLRHGHAVESVRRGIDLESLRKQMGHESLVVTQVYLRYLPADADRYIKLFTGEGQQRPAGIKVECVGCGFNGEVDQQGRWSIESMMGVAMRRR